MKTPTDFLRIASVALVMLAGSCASPGQGDRSYLADPVANHPIRVEPHAFALSFTPPSPAAGIAPTDAGRLGAFVADYLERGNGAISISVPAGSGSSDIIAMIGEKMASLGVPRTRIVVGASASDGKVTVGYMGYVAKLENCGDWTHNVGINMSNRPMPNFGCAVQRNIAAQVSDPRDLLSPRPMTAADTTRRDTMLEKYEKGQTTAAEKTEAQSGKVADVGK